MHKKQTKNPSLWARLGAILLLVLLTTTFVACEVTTTTQSIDIDTGLQQQTGTVSGADGLKLLVFPEAGEKSITGAIESAKKSVWLEIYLLTNKNVLNALEEAANRGVDVRVMLEEHPFGGGQLSPTETISRLKAADVKAQGTNRQFRFTHAKTMLIDGTDGYIMTSNFTQAALGASSQKNREYIVITKNKAEVDALTTIFNADWERKVAKYEAPNLVVSPINARSSFLSLIKEAKTSIDVQAETLQDDEVEQALADAAKKGVKVEIVIPNAQDGESMDTNNRDGAKSVQKSGGQVKEARKVYMHAKLFIIDGKKAFVGSENISTNSLNNNREIGIIISDQAVVQKLVDTFDLDWKNGQAL